MSLNNYDPESPAAKRCISQPAGLHTLCPSPTNPRKHFSEEGMAEMIKSVSEHGILQPLLVRLWPASYAWEGEMPLYEIVAGERRYRAAKAAGLPLVPVLVRDLSDQEVLELQLIENLQRQDLHPLEEARGFRELVDKHGYPIEKLVEKTGKSRSYVFGRMKLLDLDEETQRIFEAGGLSASNALLVARIPTAKLRERAIREIKIGGFQGGEMSARQAANYVQHRCMKRLSDATFPRGEDHLIPGVVRCHDCRDRTGNQAEMYDDVKSADVCTDPECFERKTAAYVDREAKAALAKGAKVLTGDAAKQVAPYGTASDMRGYTRLDDKCYEDPDRRTYRELLGDSDTVLIEDVSKGTLVSAIPNKALAEKLKAAGIGNQKEREEKDAEEARQIKAERIYRAQLIQAIRTKMGNATLGGNAPDWPAQVMDTLIRMLVRYAWDRTYDQTRKLIVTNWGTVGPNASERERAMSLRIPSMCPGETYRLLLDLLILHEACVESQWSLRLKAEHAHKIADLLLVDAQEIRLKAAGMLDESPKKGKSKATHALPDAPYPFTAAQAGDLNGPKNPAAQAGEGNAAEATPLPADAGVIEMNETPTESVREFSVGESVRVVVRDADCDLYGSTGIVIARGKYPSGINFYGIRLEDGQELNFMGGEIETNETPSAAAPAIAINDQVRVLETAIGRGGKPRGCCGKVGTVTALLPDASFEVEFPLGKSTYKAVLKASEIEMYETPAAAESPAAEDPARCPNTLDMFEEAHQ